MLNSWYEVFVLRAYVWFGFIWSKDIALEVSEFIQVLHNLSHVRFFNMPPRVCRVYDVAELMVNFLGC